MGPSDGTRFRSSKVKKVMQDILNQELEGKKYTHELSRQQSLRITDIIKQKVKELGFARYKIVVQVVVGEIKGQSIRIASRCLWDQENDNCASASFKNSSLYAVAMAFGCYAE
eukprot:TRINITY_DN19626_c0_g1::TRINITY_DN19626_c0_g1_i1::g.24466::m.24466 TRINITY_DN19626_c0_g1::TRINITY_DN19626_c0_g1_i1::g.24466  ORF type:complete len:125 (-),score=16.74,sp/A2VDD2/TC1DB_XENLA/45.00/3e-33,Tctex-1/PF03645.8/2.4e-26,DUF3827/PF12877.2/0.0082 TRINITY_DN19626_c0_g1_i1:349-687(-)